MASRLSDGMEASCYSPCPVFSVARDETTFIVGCALVGLAGGSINFGSFTVIPSIAVPDTRDACAGLAGAVWGVASVIGLLVEGRYMSHAFWRWLKAISRGKIPDTSIIGIIMIMCFAICHLPAFQKAGTMYLWKSSLGTGLLVGSILLSIIFMIVRIWLGKRTIGAPSLILAAIRYIQDIGTYSSDAGFGGSKGYVICNSNDSFRTNPMEDFTIESAFAKTLIKSLAVYDSIVSQMKAVSTGATELRKVSATEQLPDIFRS
ncbi:hypothetical protein BELL_0449g00030 [Botrytis elliptica]|uniref:Major facilitator superfamily (MFS) profile domain-containing protein n=1 Tax=Botrytis elliptica TaxID=278938 RepID=A0A4Z1JG71_9HELO|nr:hypothetical protein BELL_0449g00030 [Botrytis elliptica]